MSIYISEKPKSRQDRPVAICMDSDGETPDMLFVSENPSGDQAIKLDEELRFKLIPDVRKKVSQHVHIVGPAGSGKSSVGEEFASEFPGKVIVVSADEGEDPALMSVDGRLRADSDMQDINVEDLKSDNGVLIIFDDIEGVPKDVTKSLNVFKRALHERGRKFGVKTINIYHRGADGESTKSSLGEMTHLVVFPRFANNQNTRYMLSKYAQMPENLCDILNSPHWGRRVLIAVNDVPQYMIGDRAACIINHSTLNALSKYHKKLSVDEIKKQLERV